MNDAVKNERWVTYAGGIDGGVVRSFVNFFCNAINDRVDTVHLMIHSPGGNTSDGIALFNYFKSLPLELVAYNFGSVSSAAAIAYLGARKRIVSESGSFMIHRTVAAAGYAAARHRLQGVVDSVLVDDKRADLIINSLTLTDAQRAVYEVADLTLGAQDSIVAGIAHQIGQFSPQAPLYNI